MHTVSRAQHAESIRDFEQRSKMQQAVGTYCYITTLVKLKKDTMCTSSDTWIRISQKIPK